MSSKPQDILVRSIAKMTAMIIADKADETVRLMREKGVEVTGTEALAGFAEVLRNRDWDTKD